MHSPALVFSCTIHVCLNERKGQGEWRSDIGIQKGPKRERVVLVEVMHKASDLIHTTSPWSKRAGGLFIWIICWWFERWERVGIQFENRNLGIENNKKGKKEKKPRKNEIKDTAATYKYTHFFRLVEVYWIKLESYTRPNDHTHTHLPRRTLKKTTRPTKKKRRCWVVRRTFTKTSSQRPVYSCWSWPLWRTREEQNDISPTWRRRKRENDYFKSTTKTGWPGSMESHATVGFTFDWFVVCSTFTRKYLNF